MKISLRKANALQLLVNEKLNEPVAGTVTITKYDEVEATTQKATVQLVEDIEKKRSLLYVLFDIRQRVAHASMEVGIADLLTQLARNEKEVSFAKSLQALPVLKYTTKQITAILADIVSQKDAYGRNKDAVTVGLFNETANEELKNVLTTLRKEKTEISDKLLHLNVSTEIELDEKEVSVLKKYDIL